MYEIDKPRLKSSHLPIRNLSGCGDKRELNNLKVDLTTTNVENTAIKNSIDIKLIIFHFSFFLVKSQLLEFVTKLLGLEHFF